MKTTVIIGFVDYYDYLDESIQSALNQTVPVDIILVNSGDVERVNAFMQKYPTVKVIHMQGDIAGRLNAGVRASTTPYFLPLGADDRLYHHYIEIAENIMDFEGYDIVNCNCMKFGIEPGYWRIDGELADDIRENNHMFAMSVTSKSLWEKVGGFNENIPVHGWEDWDLWIKAWKAGARAFHIPAPMFEYRTHERQFTRVQGPNLAGFMQYVKNTYYDSNS